MKFDRSSIIFASFMLLSSILLLNCKKDDVEIIPVVTVPDMVLEQALTSKDNGLTLKLKVNRVPDSLVEYGFVIGKDSTFRSQLPLVKVVKQSAALAVGELTVKIGSGLMTDSLYYVKPYVLKKNFTQRTYNVKSFIWQGDRPLQIDSLYPLKGIMGDTLTLKGKQFAERSLSIKFGEYLAAVISTNDSVITMIVPSNLKEINPIVTLISNGKVDTVTQDFVLSAPQISQFTTTGTFRDTVTISGNNFSRFSTGNVVKFGNVEAKITSFSRTTLKAIVPDDIELSRTVLTVAAQLQVASGQEQFVIRKPELTVVPSKGTSYDEIILKGKYFHPEVSKNILTFEGNAAMIIGGSSSELKTNIPFAPYPKRKARVVLKLLDYEVSYPVELALLEKWILVDDAKPFMASTNSNAFMLDNVPYVIAYSVDYWTTKPYLWKFDATSLLWKQVTGLPFNPEHGASIATVGGKAYVYAGGMVDSFWQYDPSDNRWTKKKDYPALERLAGTMFAIGNNVYLGMGVNNGSIISVPDNTFYKYNTTNDTWSKETDYPAEFGDGGRGRLSSFVIGDKAYIACGATNSGMKQFRSYQPATHTWQKLADFPEARIGTTAFTAGGFGFVAGGSTFEAGSPYDCFRYNVAADRWDGLKDPLGPQILGANTMVDDGYSFVIGDRAFVGGGENSSAQNRTFMIDVKVLLGSAN